MKRVGLKHHVVDGKSVAQLLIDGEVVPGFDRALGRLLSPDEWETWGAEFLKRMATDLASKN